MAMSSRLLVFVGKDVLPSQVVRSIELSHGFVRTIGFQYGAVNPSCMCSRQLRVAAGKRRPRLVVFNSTSRQSVKIPSEKSEKEQFPVIDHKVWVSSQPRSEVVWMRGCT